MGRKRKLFLGTEPIGGKAMKSRRKARFVTSQYHNIRNEISAMERDQLIQEEDKDEKRKCLNEKLEAIGGVDKYQQASIISTSHFKTSRWVVSTLEQLGSRENSALHTSRKVLVPDSVGVDIAQVKNKVPAPKLKVLEVGAINMQLQQCPWLDVRAIDVNSQHPSIEECDFFDITPTGSFDVVVCSMVINCITEPTRRGEMLARLLAHIKPETGVLFLVLPLRCVKSKYLKGKFDLLLGEMGFVHLSEKRTTPRLAFYVLARGEGISKGKGKGQGKNRIVDVDCQQEEKDHVADEVGGGSDEGSEAVASSSSGSSRKRKVQNGFERSGEDREEEKGQGRPSPSPVPVRKKDNSVIGRQQRIDAGVIEETIKEGRVGEERVGEGARGTEGEGEKGAESVHWMTVVRASVAASSKNRGVLDYFRTDFSHVPTTFFSISMATMLDSASVNAKGNAKGNTKETESRNRTGNKEGTGFTQGGRRKKPKVIKSSD